MACLGSLRSAASNLTHASSHLPAAARPLRERQEEIPPIALLVTAPLTKKPVSTHLIEECLLSVWRNTNHRLLQASHEAAARRTEADEPSKAILPKHLEKREPWDDWPAPSVAPSPTYNEQVDEDLEKAL